MIDRQKLETILQRRFPGATLEQIAAAANAIMALDDAGDSREVYRRESGTEPGTRARTPHPATASNLPFGGP